MKSNITVILLALLAGLLMFQFKTQLGPLLLPLFLILVGFVTFRFYRLMEKDDDDSY
ncbi:hypothetical protein [Paraferrimonas haliotis]|uniref:Uncharacterized protein n=1 Tax=Paraferrimonas haliotis TaxID=2013866 RepID=A0AA37TNG5_9GAMM|nr:hypothetical protein [Paraferrimonas haliotis]GLS82635.1 hypothetical protein GCM10007894_06120 [Paraferrimonas haliotis]